MKINYLIGIKRIVFLISLSFILCIITQPLLVLAKPIFTQTETNLTAEPTDTNYYLASLTNEEEYYPPTFYEDYLLKLNDKSIAHFTKRGNDIADFYFYIDDADDLKFIEKFFSNHQKEVDAISLKIIPAFTAYSKIKPAYEENNLYKAVAKIIIKINSIATESLVNPQYKNKLDAALFRYLQSNGITTLEEISTNKPLLGLIVDKFFMLGNTCFYRDWKVIGTFKEYLPQLKTRLEKEKQPFKIKVFACSTGEEVITYAIDLLEYGITNFTILGSDINQASLDFAREMKYSNNSFRSLPLSTQEKIKKYFTLNKDLDIWQLKDPDFFKDRIKYIEHNILDNLPKNLDPQFAPPYSLISILNVLLYLDDSAIQKKKKYWLNLLVPNGILIIHDQKYSILKRMLDTEWSFENFFIVNEWVNIKTSKSYTNDKKIADYEKDLSSPSEANIMRLNDAYIHNNQSAKGLILCKNYLNQHPFSLSIYLLLLEHYYRNNNPVEAKNIILSLINIHIFPETIIAKLIPLEKNPADLKFLEEIKNRYETFTQSLSKNPKSYETLFDFTSPTSKNYTTLRLIFKAAAYDKLQKYYFTKKQNDDAIRTAQQGIETIKEIITNNPQYLIASTFLDNILRSLIDFYTSQKNFTQIIAICNEGISILEKGFTDKNYIFISDCLAYLNLKKATAYDIEGKYTSEYKTLLDNAIFYYQNILPQVINYGSASLRVCYDELGQCYFLRGKFYFANNNLKLAQDDFTQAQNYYEKGLETDTMYGKKVVKTRDELFNFLNTHNISLK